MLQVIAWTASFYLASAGDVTQAGTAPIPCSEIEEWSTCTVPGQKCHSGQECCCGECYPSLVGECDTLYSFWVMHYSHACWGVGHGSDCPNTPTKWPTFSPFYIVDTRSPTPAASVIVEPVPTVSPTHLPTRPPTTQAPIIVEPFPTPSPTSEPAKIATKQKVKSCDAIADKCDDGEKCEGDIMCCCGECTPTTFGDCHGGEWMMMMAFYHCSHGIDYNGPKCDNWVEPKPTPTPAPAKSCDAVADKCEDGEKCEGDIMCCCGECTPTTTGQCHGGEWQMIQVNVHCPHGIDYNGPKCDNWVEPTPTPAPGPNWCDNVKTGDPCDKLGEECGTGEETCCCGKCYLSEVRTCDRSVGKSGYSWSPITHVDYCLTAAWEGCPTEPPMMVRRLPRRASTNE